MIDKLYLVECAWFDPYEDYTSEGVEFKNIYLDLEKAKKEVNAYIPDEVKNGDWILSEVFSKNIPYKEGEKDSTVYVRSIIVKSPDNIYEMHYTISIEEFTVSNTDEELNIVNTVII